MEDFAVYHPSIRKLQRLRPMAHGNNEDATANHIEFVITATKNPLFNDLLGNFLHKYDLSSRDLDACLENGDSDLVVHGVLDRAKGDRDLMEALNQKWGPKSLGIWWEYYEEVEARKPQQHLLML